MRHPSVKSTSNRHNPFACTVRPGQKMATCQAFLQEQRQVCTYLSQTQTERISRGLQILGARGVSVFGSSGDGGSHFSFGPFNDAREIGVVLNEISCQVNGMVLALNHADVWQLNLH